MATRVWSNSAHREIISSTRYNGESRYQKERGKEDRLQELHDESLMIYGMSSMSSQMACLSNQLDESSNIFHSIFDAGDDPILGSMSSEQIAVCSI